MGGVSIVAGSVTADFTTSDIGGYAVNFDDDGGSFIRMPDSGSASGIIGTPLTSTKIHMPNYGLYDSQHTWANVYAPATVVSYTSTSTTLAAVDTTHMTMSFVAPVSGNVLVRLSGLTICTTAAYAWWGVLDHTTGNLRGNPGIVFESPTYGSAAQPVVTEITGLTPGATYQIDWALATSTASDDVALNLEPPIDHLSEHP